MGPGRRLDEGLGGAEDVVEGEADGLQRAGDELLNLLLNYDMRLNYNKNKR